MKKLPFFINKFLIHAPPDLCLIIDQSDESKIFFVHKIILMCISPYFQKMIQYKKGLSGQKIICSCNTSSNNVSIQQIEKSTNNNRKINYKISGEETINISKDEINVSFVDKESSIKNIENLPITFDSIKTNINIESADYKSLKKKNDEDKHKENLIQKCRKVNKKIEKDYLTLRLIDIDEKILSIIINYAYGGKIEINCHNVQDLIIACDMYNIPALLELCSNFFIENLTIYNTIGVYLLAKKHNFHKLRVYSKKYILRYYEQIYELSEEFVKYLSANELKNIVDQDLLYVIDEYIVFKSIVKWIEFNEKSRSHFFGELLQKIRLGLISNERLENQILNHQLVSSNLDTQTIVKEIIKLKKYLQTWGQPSQQMLRNSIKKYLTPRYPLDLIFVFGGRVLDVEFVTPESMVEVYDHRAERWKRITFAEDPAGPRDHHQTIVVKSNIYMIGGHSGPFNVFNSCRKFDLLSKKWSEIAPMNEKRTFLAGAVIDDTIYAIGGFNGSWRVNTVERYNILLNQWQMVTSMTERRSGAGASVLNKKIYVVGGFRNLVYLRFAEFYDPLTNMWTNIALMTKPRSNPCVVTLNGFIYAIGGLANQKLLSSAEKYDSVTNSWSVLEEEMFEKKCSAAAVVLEDKIFVIGGWNGLVGLHTVEIWCSKTKKWYQGSKLQKRRTGCSACLVKDVPNIQDYGIVERENLIDERYKNSLEANHVSK